MRIFLQRPFSAVLVGLALWFGAAGHVTAADTLDWNTNRNIVSADVQSMEVHRLLERVARRTGWQIYIESDTSLSVSARFKDLPTGEALRRLLGDLNFALVPQTNGSPRLYVFHSSQQNATQLIQPDSSPLAAAAKGKAILNELIVRLKPGANIDELARALGAKVIGRIDGLNAYRLQFDDAEAAQSAREKLAGNSDVAAVESNYAVDAPPSAQRLDIAGAPPIQLKLNPPEGSDRAIVGLIDMAVQKLGNDLDKFLIKSISVAGTPNADASSPTHGTSMFENILRAAASVSGGSSSMQVLSVDIYGPNATTSTFDLANGIVQAVNNGANIINLSLGSTGDSPFLHDLIQQVTQKGIPIFAAAGNNASSELFYPAAYPEVNSVTAGNQGKLAGYANYGPSVDLIAPGTGVVQYGDNAFLVSGTSTSTAYVSGTVAATSIAKHVPIIDVTQAIRNSPAFKYTATK